jgi:hypothetical protein
MLKPIDLQDIAQFNNGIHTESTIKLDYARTLTDDFGMIQHAVGGVPDLQHGYSTDDNCRALLAMTRIWRNFPELRSESEVLIRIYAWDAVYGPWGNVSQEKCPPE